jgi:hypothetical protein
MRLLFQAVQAAGPLRTAAKSRMACSLIFDTLASILEIFLMIAFPERVEFPLRTMNLPSYLYRKYIAGRAEMSNTAKSVPEVHIGAKNTLPYDAVSDVNELSDEIDFSRSRKK